MILVSFSSAEDALSNDVKKHNTISSQGTENPLFRFFWDTRYSSLCIYMYMYTYTSILVVILMIFTCRYP